MACRSPPAFAYQSTLHPPLRTSSAPATLSSTSTGSTSWLVDRRSPSSHMSWSSSPSGSTGRGRSSILSETVGRREVVSMATIVPTRTESSGVKVRGERMSSCRGGKGWRGDERRSQTEETCEGGCEPGSTGTYLPSDPRADPELAHRRHRRSDLKRRIDCRPVDLLPYRAAAVRARGRSRRALLLRADIIRPLPTPIRPILLSSLPIATFPTTTLLLLSALPTPSNMTLLTRLDPALNLLDLLQPPPLRGLPLRSLHIHARHKHIARQRRPFRRCKDMLVWTLATARRCGHAGV